MYCTKCGNEINDNAVICPNCGCSTEIKNEVTAISENPTTTTNVLENEEKSTLATCALAFAFLMPIVGLICGIVGIVKYQSKELKKRCIIAIPVSIVVWIFTMIIFLMG